MNTKTDLILGCTGQDGSFLCKSLLKKGHSIIGLSRKVNNEIHNHAKLGIANEFEIEEGDVTNFQLIEKLISKHQPGRIFNLAAQSSVGKSINEPIDTIKGIVMGTLNLLEVSKKLHYPGKIFFAGSSEMFGDTKNPANIDHKQHPVSPYGIGKQTSFNLVKYYRNIHKIKGVTGVLFNHESHLRNENFVTQKIINGAVQIKKKELKKLKVGNINVIRDWGWAPEYVDAIQLIADSNDLKDHVICTGSSKSLKEFIEKVFNAFDLDWQKYVEIDKDIYRPCDIKQSYGDPLPLFNELGWKAEKDFEYIIDQLISNITN